MWTFLALLKNRRSLRVTNVSLSCLLLLPLLPLSFSLSLSCYILSSSLHSAILLFLFSSLPHSPSSSAGRVQSEEYSSWAAGCRMIMKGRPLAKAGYEQELASIKGFIAMQNKADTGVSAKACSDKVRMSSHGDATYMVWHRDAIWYDTGMLYGMTQGCYMVWHRGAIWYDTGMLYGMTQGCYMVWHRDAIWYDTGMLYGMTQGCYMVWHGCYMVWHRDAIWYDTGMLYGMTQGCYMA